MRRTEAGASALEVVAREAPTALQDEVNWLGVFARSTTGRAPDHALIVLEIALLQLRGLVLKAD